MPLPTLLAPPLRSTLDPRSESYAENRAAKVIGDELKSRLAAYLSGAA